MQTVCYKVKNLHISKMTVSSKDAEGEIVSSDDKIKADLEAHRGLYHQTTETMETKLLCLCRCKG